MSKEPEPMLLDELVAKLDAEVKAKSAGRWDAPRAFRHPADRHGNIRLQFLSLQGNIRVSRENAEEYLSWLQSGQSGTVMFWAKQIGRRL